MGTLVALGCDLPYFREPGEIRDFAQAAEELGYDIINFSEHVAATTDSPFPPGFSFEDPWHESMTLAAYLAGVTRRITISTSMYLLPLRPTVLAAKQAAEVDSLTGGRFRLGVAVGWNDREVAALGQDSRTRGARFEEQIEVLRLLWTQPAVTYAGSFHDLRGVGIHPRPGRSIPVWIGAGSFAGAGVPDDRLLRRIARIADGYKMFAPLGLDEVAAVTVVDRVRRFAQDAGRNPADLAIEARLLAQALPEEDWADVVARWAERGVTHIGLGNRVAGGGMTEQVALIERVIRTIRQLLVVDISYDQLRYFSEPRRSRPDKEAAVNLGMASQQDTVGSAGPARPLEGLRAVDFGQYLAGPLVAAFLADAGADVVRVDPPTGPRWNHPTNAMLQRGKRSIALDLKDENDRHVARRLVQRADIVVENFRPAVMERFGLGPDAALAANPRLLYCSLPGFGADDPRAHVPGWEGVVSAAAGLYLYPGCTPMDYIGDRSGEPIFSALPVASSYAAFVAAHTIAAALIARERTGLGQRIEVPLFDACFELIGSSVMKTERPPAAPGGPRMTAGLPQLGHYQCADGRWLELCLFQDKHLRWFAETFLPGYIEDGMGDAVRMLTDPALQERARKRYADLLATRPAREWEIAINEQSGASAALSQTSEDWLTLDSHARDSGAVLELTDPEYGPTAQAGFPIRMSLTPPAVAFARRPLGADREDILAELAQPAPVVKTPPGQTELGAPLAGIRVLDVAQVLAGPTVGRILAEYGADVIKIHSFVDRQLGMHLYTNSGKRSIMLNLKTADGMAVFDRLSEGIDVFTQNFTRGVTDRMGIGEQALRARSPGLIYVSISAFGHEGYRGGWRGREQLGQGPTGMQVRLGGDGEPLMAPYPYNDYGSGNLAAFATLLALYHRMRGGSGQHVQSSLTHSGTFLQIPFMVAFAGRTWDEPRGQSAKGWSPSDRLYPGADRWFYVCAPNGLDGVAELAGLGETQLAEVFRTRPGQEWVDRLTAAGAGAHVLVDQPDLMDDEVVRARGLSVERDHPGFGRARMAGPSPRLSRTPPRPAYPVGPPGSDTRAVLDEFGLDSEDLIARDIAREGLPDGAAFIGMFR